MTTGGDCVRVLLAILVGLGQVAGPWLCCCPTARADAPAAAAPAEPACPHCKTERPAPPEKPAPGLPEPCPCGGSPALLPAPPAKPDSAAVLDLSPPPAAGFVAPLVVALPVPPVGVSELPFLPPGTRLFVHHVLRC